MKAQEYFDLHFSKKEKEVQTALTLRGKKLKGKIEGEVDLSIFPNLKKFGLEDNYEKTINRVDFSKNFLLEEVDLHEASIIANLNIFSHLKNLKRLDLGMPFGTTTTNNFYGSLKSLENCKQLEFLCIGQQVNIKDGLEYLPLDKLTYFGCHGTVFQE